MIIVGIMNMNTPDNMRSRRTVQRMEEVYLELLASDPDRQVSVMQLCSYANVNRSTFYSHYSDVFDLQRKIEKRISNEVSAIFTDKGYGENRMTRERFAVLLEYIRKNRLFYNAWFVCGRMDDPSAIASVLNRPNMTQDNRFSILFYKAGISAVIRDWVIRGCAESNERVLSVLADICNL